MEASCTYLALRFRGWHIRASAGDIIYAINIKSRLADKDIGCKIDRDKAKNKEHSCLQKLFFFLFFNLRLLSPSSLLYL